LTIYSFFLIRANLPGLPERIPARFGPDGQPNAWNDPGTLWMLLAVQTLGTLVLLSIPYLGQRFPHLVNLGRRKLSDFQPAARERVLPRLEEMCHYLALLFSLMFAFIIAEIIRVALMPQSRFRYWFLAGFVMGYVVVVYYYLRRISRTATEAKAHDSVSGPA